MRMLKKAVSTIVILVMAVNLAGCSTQRLSQKKMRKLARELDLDRCETMYEFLEYFSKLPDNTAAYFSTSGDSAQYIYDSVFYQFNINSYSEHNVGEATSFFYSDESGWNVVILFSFGDSEDAKSFFEEASDLRIQDGQSGQENGYSYVVKSYGEEKYSLNGFYVEGNNVMFIKAFSGDTGFVEEVCGKTGVKSPAGY